MSGSTSKGRSNSEHSRSRARVGTVAEHKTDHGRVSRCRGRHGQGTKVGTLARDEHPDGYGHAYMNLTRWEDASTTEPSLHKASSPNRSGGAGSAGTITTIPTPMLNVRHMSSGSMPPSRCRAWKIDGTSHAPRSSSTPRPAGRTAGDVLYKAAACDVREARISVRTRSSRTASR